MLSPDFPGLDSRRLGATLNIMVLWTRLGLKICGQADAGETCEGFSTHRDYVHYVASVLMDYTLDHSFKKQILILVTQHHLILYICHANRFMAHVQEILTGPKIKPRKEQDQTHHQKSSTSHARPASPPQASSQH